MRGNVDEIGHLLRTGHGVIRRRDHAHLATTLTYLVTIGRLAAVLPGVYADSSVAGLATTRMRAAAAREPNGVLTGAAATRLTFWPEVTLDEISMAVPSRRAPQVGFRWERRTIPFELASHQQGLLCTVPALTALDLCASQGGDAIDAALRSRQATLPQLQDALSLTLNRNGNSDRRQLLLDSRDEPWSPAERQAHRVFRADGLRGWVGNYRLDVHGCVYYIDIAFPQQRLAVEIDGRSYHSDRVAFERDRWRQNDIVLAGWRVLRFTVEMLHTCPELVTAMVRAALRSPLSDTVL